MEKLKIVILEDDKTAAFVLENLLEKLYGNIFTVVGTVPNVSDGIKLILEKSPDLVFLDVLLSDRSGFDLFKDLKIVNFETIIITGDVSNALEAIKIQALDFLVKPINSSDLEDSINKFFAKRIKNYRATSEKIRILTSNGLINVYTNDIIFCEANGNYTFINYSNGISHQILRSLKELEDILVPYGFFRVQKSFLVNIEHIVEYSKADGGFVKLKYYEDRAIPVSKNLREKLMEIFN